MRPEKVPFLEGIPDILYKYRNWNEAKHRSIISELEIYLSSSDQLNDPFDLALPFLYSEAELTNENIWAKLIQVGPNRWPGISNYELQKRAKKQFDYIINNKEEWLNNGEKTIKELVKNSFGIFSLAQNKNNILMWSHYSDSHKGFVIGFDMYELFKAVGGGIGPVIYQDEFPTIPLFDQSLHHSIKLLLTKSNHWSYEEEFRLTKNKGQRCLFKLPIKAISEIIIGVLMPSQNIDDLLANLAKNKFKGKVFKAKLMQRNFGLDFDELTI